MKSQGGLAIRRGTMPKGPSFLYSVDPSHDPMNLLPAAPREVPCTRQVRAVLMTQGGLARHQAGVF